MTETLQKIDSDLIELEERLLVELGRLRKLDSADTYSDINPDLKRELKLTYTALVEALAATADTKVLSLKSDEQLFIEDRMRIVRNLLVSKLPTAFLSLSHAEHRHHTRQPGESEKHTASRELAILSSQVNQHVREGRSIEEIAKERAQFNSKEISKGHAQELASSKREIAQSPDEIRKKLAGKSGTQGPSSFAAREEISKGHAQELASSKREIAQSPDEIRKKLAGKSGTQGPSSFAARDLSTSLPTPPPEKSKPRDIAQTPEAIKAKLAQRQAEAAAGGKAVFGSKDIESVAEKLARTERMRKAPEKPSGKAIFDSKDLSDS